MLEGLSAIIILYITHDSKEQPTGQFSLVLLFSTIVENGYFSENQVFLMLIQPLPPKKIRTFNLTIKRHIVVCPHRYIR